MRLRLDVGDGAPLGGLRYPGQYVGLATVSSEPRWFVVASRATELPVAEFLIGLGAEVSDALAALRPGDPVRVSAPQGAGFDLSRVGDRAVALFASGTGLAAVRPVIDELLASGAPASRLALYYQERVRGSIPTGRPACEFALATERASWQARGVTVQTACDARPHGAADFVDALWRSTPGRAAATETTFIVCGNEALDTQVEALLASEGVDPGVILRNY